jgi:hypothetical protein
MATNKVGLQVTSDVVSDIKWVRRNEMCSGSVPTKWDGPKRRYDTVKWANTGAIVQT